MKHKFDRRSFVMGSTAGALGLGALAPLMFPQDAAPLHPEVLDFWIKRVGVPEELILGAARAKRKITEVVNVRGGTSDYGSEPLFLYVDEQENALIPAQEMRGNQLLPYGDVAVDMSVGRLRLNGGDIKTFQNYTTSGIYFEIGQDKPRTAPNLTQLGWSMFGALFPQTFTKVTGQKAAPAAVAATPAPVGGLLQSIGLPNGAGQAMFNCFLKDQKKSAFGSFLSAFTQLGTQAATAFVPMLMLPGIASPAMNFVRGLVARLQGDEQKWLFQQAPMNLACTAETAQQRPTSLKLRTGNYIVLPKSQASMLKNSLTNMKVLDGFLVPKQATMFDVYDAAPQAASGVSYITANVTVRRTQLNYCGTTAVK